MNGAVGSEPSDQSVFSALAVLGGLTVPVVTPLSSDTDYCDPGLSRL